MAQLNKLRPGQILYTVSRGRMGNTTLHTVNVHSVCVLEVNELEGYALASWNGNPKKKYGPREISTWKVSEPITVEGCFGSKRLANRDEKAKILAERAAKQSR